MVVVLTGHIEEGFEVYGPFDNERQAREWSEEKLPDDEVWWVMVLVEP